MEASPVSLEPVTDINEQFSAAIGEWKLHALSKYPQEACGFVLADGSFKPAENIHENPNRHFRISEIDFTFAGDVVGFLHSHTPAEAEDLSKAIVVRAHPTALDQKTQISMDVPWGLSTVAVDEVSDPLWWGDSLPIMPLLSRPFVFGVYDCLSLVRDWHRLQGITFPNFPREFGFWLKTDDHEPEDLYIQNLAAAGFERVYREDGQLVPGDVALWYLRSTVRNHAVVYLGNGLMLHHTLEKLSKRDPVAPWMSKMDYIVRHKDLPDDAEIKDVVDAA